MLLPLSSLWDAGGEYFICRLVFVVPVVAVDRSLWARFKRGDELVGGGGKEGLLRPTELDLSRLEDSVLERNEPEDLVGVSAPLWLLEELADEV